MKKLYLWSVLLMLVGVSCEEKQATQVQELTVEMRTNPIGLDVSQPRFNWMITQAKPNTMQTAYRVVVAGSAADLKGEQNLLWDSGTVTSDQSTFVTYAGTPLESRKTYFWKVFVTTSQGDSLWSKPAQWTMALLDSTDWKSQWIGTDSLIGPNETLEGNTRVAARYLRKEFAVDKKIESAMLYISGLGLYECYLNGQKVSQDIFAPTASDYHKQVYYNTYDVQSFMRDKKNTLGVVLGNGRYVALRSQGHYHFGMPKLLAQLEITYTDGSQSVIVSDESWKLTANGPIVANNEFDGEEYDANKEMKDWSKRGFDDQAWMNAQIVGAPAGKLSAQLNPNIATMEQLTPKSIKQLNDSTYVLDMGQNMVGWLAVTLKGQKDRPIRMRFSETLKDNDSLYMANLRGAKVTDIYVPSTDG
ncbi:MAG: family 78 glycoside hydrolase catalytic domain, partial [Alistipes sp.]|nr:family 78 glycoside hydrolase catalytic domain [Alistipes sp.]